MSDDKKEKRRRLISKSTHLTEITTSDFTIKGPANVQLHGTVIGNIELLPGAELAIHGKVVGDVTNRGGLLSVFGEVEGRVEMESGTTHIDPRAKVTR